MSGDSIGTVREHTTGDLEIPDHVHLPSPSIWPIVLAAGITIIAFGLLTTTVFSAVGVMVMAVALWGWIGEIIHE